jgi:HAD superfamily hydrolase (TIGR01490 family)
MAGRPFAAFDIDGTIIRWQLYHAVADKLAHSGQLDADSFDKVRAARMRWKNRTHQTSYNDYELTLVKLVDEAITGIGVKDVKLASGQVIDEYKDQVYTYTRDLIQELKSKNYLLFAISASQVEIVELIAEYYGFDDFAGSSYEIKQGRFTGKKDVLRRERKPEVLRELVAKHNAGFEGSIAVGDSEGDIPMLSIVEQPIAFNPTRELFEHARDKRWKVVVERKNMVYELEPDDDSYRLQA